MEAEIVTGLLGPIGAALVVGGILWNQWQAIRHPPRSTRKKARDR